MRIGFGRALAFFTVAALVSAAQFAVTSPAEARRIARAHAVKHVHVHKHNRYVNRRVARGVAVGVTTGVVVSRSARYNTCSNLRYRCNRGEVWACIDHDTRCY